MGRKLGLVLVGALAAAILALAGCSGSGTASSSGSTGSGSQDVAQSEAYQLVSPEDAKQLIDDGTVQVVDVRTADEYASGHIEGAVNIPVDSIGSTQPSQLSDLDAPVLVYCRTGVRSKQAATALVNLGYKHVYDLQGGITNWPYDTVK